MNQLAIVVFRNTANNFLAVPNFPRAKPIQIVRLPPNNEGQNKILFKPRIDTGQRWCIHIPEAFNNELISTMLLNVRLTTSKLRYFLPTMMGRTYVAYLQGTVEDALLDGERAEVGEEDVALCESDEDKEGEIDLTNMAELTDPEVRINNNSSFHRLCNVNIQIHCCVLCKQTMLQFAVQVHYHKTHTVHMEREKEEEEEEEEGQQWRVVGGGH